MKESKLIQHYQALEKDEYKALGKMARSTFFNKREGVIALHNCIVKAAPDFNLDKNKVFEKVFGKSVNFQAKKLADSVYHLNNLVVKFIEMKALETDEREREFVYLKTLIERNAIELFHKEADKFIEKIKRTNIDFSTYYYVFQIENLKYSFPLKGNLNLVSSNDVYKTSIELDNFYFSNKLMFAHELGYLVKSDTDAISLALTNEVKHEVLNNEANNDVFLKIISFLYLKTPSSISEYLLIKEQVLKT